MNPRRRLDALTRLAQRDPPPILGGQGRTDEDILDGAAFGAVWIAIVAGCLLVWWLFWGFLR